MNIKDVMTTAEFEDGGWVSDPPGLKGVQFKVRNIGCREFKKLQASILDRITRAEKARGLSPEKSDAITERCIREALLLDWRGLEHDGQPLPYSPEWAEKLLKSPIFREAVAFCASVVGTPGFQEGGTRGDEAASAGASDHSAEAA